MCGIIGILSRPSSRPAPSAEELVAGLDRALAARPDTVEVARLVAGVDALARGLPGLLTLLSAPAVGAAIVDRLDELDVFLADREQRLEEQQLNADEVEAESGSLIALRDAVWALRRDRLPTAQGVAELAGCDPGEPALAVYLAIQQALSALDRLEVRGRDSAGIHLFVWHHGLADDDAGLASAAAGRDDPLFQSRAVRVAGSGVSFVYKAAAEIGELGDNTRALRRAIHGDELLRRALRAPAVKAAVLGHTRWASVGVISEANAHPVNSDELDRGAQVGADEPYVVAVLNGDVDNHADLRAENELRFSGSITTDAKVIPSLIARHRQAGTGDVEAFRRAVSSFEGSVAITAASADCPDQLLLALNGSGQALYVGLAEDAYIVASEPYGVVEETSRYVRLDGENGGEVVVLDGKRAGTLEGIGRLTYGGVASTVADDDVVTAEITTRDIDRGDAPHFLLKEITEAPASMRKTLRAKINDDDDDDDDKDGRLRVDLGELAFPADIADRLKSGELSRIRVIGQGTAAVAGQSMAAVLDELAEGTLDVDALTATEMSGFNLRLDMRDTLAVAVSQSGTTTDTNRTVDLLRSRGASVIGIVNRRGSDLTDKADGVLYTSDGRDVEMSVASTKAFYSQVAAGVLLACAISDAAGVGSDDRRHQLLESLRSLPDAMNVVLAGRSHIADVAHRLAPTKRYWAVVGSGPNKVAAEEVRIKLSELCYKSIACDVTEDKKHIDLSSEPLILVCAAGLSGGTASDVVKEVAIFRAHKATPIVIASEGEQRFDAAALITVPSVDPALGFVLSAMAGHLFGYEAALAIDGSAHPLHQARREIELASAESSTGAELLERAQVALRPLAETFFDDIRTDRYNGHLEASTAVRLTGMLRNVISERPLEAYGIESGKVATPSNLIDDLLTALTQAIGELTRPIDAIKHQAKTVTVGISRSDEGVLDRPLVQAVLSAGAGRDVLAYRVLKALADLDPAVAEVTGFTRYRIDRNAISIVDRGGVSRDLRSRVDTTPALVGTKRRVANERDVVVARGRRDNRTVILVPEIKGGECTGITLLQVRFHDRLPAPTMRAVLAGYDRRYDRLVDWVTETEGEFDESRLGDLPVEVLLTESISDVASLWLQDGGASGDPPDSPGEG